MNNIVQHLYKKELELSQFAAKHEDIQCTKKRKLCDE